ncbi:MAG TPA: hypothetical protein VMM76_09215, partial [Pirellulaceae bacterium]|nr:hypothetical protein [Pirellulaceae bacterium]
FSLLSFLAFCILMGVTLAVISPPIAGLIKVWLSQDQPPKIDGRSGATQSLPGRGPILDTQS